MIPNGMEEGGDEIPETTPVHEVEKEGPNEAVVLIDVWMPHFRDEMENKTIRKTVTVPRWLNTKWPNLTG